MLPFIGILFANRAAPFVLGMPFILFWNTLHVRAVLGNDATGAERRSAYAARHTFLVR
jgi:hypothetical protein